MADAADAPDFTNPLPIQSRSKAFSWTMSGTSKGRAVLAAGMPDKNVQAWDGAWGSATLVWEGTLDPRGDPENANYASAEFQTLTDTNETDLSQTVDSTRPQQVLQNPTWIRPKTTGGTNTVVTAIMNMGR